jgi:hypothetical protein
MKDDVFQNWLEQNQSRLTVEDLEAFMDVRDTLRPAEAAAQSAFGSGKYTNDDVIAIAALMLERLPRERRRIPDMPRPAPPESLDGAGPF